MTGHRTDPEGHSAPRGHPGPRWPGTPRDEVLARIRSALGAGEVADSGTEPVTHRSLPPEPGYRTLGDRDAARRLDLLAERLADYRAAVRRAVRPELAATVGAALTERGVRRVVVPAGLDLLVVLQALPPDVDLIIDDNLSPQDLDAVDGVITGAAVAIAETGTIVLDGSPDQGRRAITLVPDYHLCIVRADQVVELVPEAVARLDPRPGRPLTWISGPSATSDIELSRVEGVHGPRTLEVILVEPG
jgi:L-lactate dehydrogenase complex protein LldG